MAGDVKQNVRTSIKAEVSTFMVPICQYKKLQVVSCQLSVEKISRIGLI